MLSRTVFIYIRVVYEVYIQGCARVPDAVGTHAPGRVEGVEGFRSHFGQLRGHLRHVIVSAFVVKGNGCKGNAKCWRVDGTVNDSALSKGIHSSPSLRGRDVRAEIYAGQRLRIGDREFSAGLRHFCWWTYNYRTMKPIPLSRFTLTAQLVSLLKEGWYGEASGRGEAKGRL